MFLHSTAAPVHPRYGENKYFSQKSMSDPGKAQQNSKSVTRTEAKISLHSTATTPIKKKKISLHRPPLSHIQTTFSRSRSIFVWLGSPPPLRDSDWLAQEGANEGKGRVWLVRLNFRSKLTRRALGGNILFPKLFASPDFSPQTKTSPPPPPPPLPKYNFKT
jgi:hypothetical protein